MSGAVYPDTLLAELLGDESLTLQELARACRREPEWISEHVEAGVIRTHTIGNATITVTPSPTSLASLHGAAVNWRFASETLVRARRVSDLEACFGADPNLAALTVDLMEEVLELRRQLNQQASG